MSKWLYYSGLWITLVCNPFHWRVSYHAEEDTHTVQLFMLTIRLVISNGRW